MCFFFISFTSAAVFLSYFTQSAAICHKVRRLQGWHSQWCCWHVVAWWPYLARLLHWSVDRLTDTQRRIIIIIIYYYPLSALWSLDLYYWFCVYCSVYVCVCVYVCVIDKQHWEHWVLPTGCKTVAFSHWVFHHVTVKQHFWWYHSVLHLEKVDSSYILHQRTQLITADCFGATYCDMLTSV